MKKDFLRPDLITSKRGMKEDLGHESEPCFVKSEIGSSANVLRMIEVS